jgi:hypothetical protein
MFQILILVLSISQNLEMELLRASTTICLCKTDFRLSPRGSVSNDSSLLVETHQQLYYPLLLVIITYHLMQYSLLYNKHHILMCSISYKFYCVEFDVLTAVDTKNPIFFDITPCSLLKVN